MSDAIRRILTGSGTAYDPDLMGHLKIIEKRLAQPSPNTRDVILADLVPGMVLAAPVRSLGGRLILTGDTRLQEVLIRQLERYHAVDPIDDRIRVYA